MAAPSAFPVLVTNPAAYPQQLQCLAKPCKDLSHNQDLQSLLLSGHITVSFTWSDVAAASGVLPAPPGPLAVLHAIAGDAGPDIRLLPDTETPRAADAFAQWHQDDCAKTRCTIVRFPTRDLELVLVPVVTKTGAKGTPGPTYWGFTVPANLLPLIASTINASRLFAVLDIDETLLMAHTVDSLATRLQRIKAERESKAAELQAAEEEAAAAAGQGGSSGSQGAGADGDKVQQLKATLLALKTEQVLLRKDFDMLSSFRQDAACRVTLGGQTYEPSWECTRLSSGVEVTRPVVRLDIDGRPVIFTRIHPESRSTSLLIRLRPGWEALREYLAGEDALRSTGMRKARWEVYLCTTAEREYAWEAWRLLDPTASIFPLEQLSWRMLCVQHPQKKDLLNVLRKQVVDSAGAMVPRMASDPQMVTDAARASRPPLGSPAPLCVVVDDRLDVWEPDSRKAVMQVLPFHPHKEAAALDLGPEAAPPQQHQQAQDSEAELARVVSTMKDIRSTTYQTLDKEVRPEAQRLTTTGVMDQLQDTAASILATLLVPLTPVPKLLADSPHRPPASLGTDKDDRASDLRLLVHDGTMGGAAAVGAADGVPTDPRKRRLAAIDGSGGSSRGGGGAAAAAAAAAEDNQPQQPAGKKRKKEKVKLFEGVDLASIMTAIGNDEQQDDQQQQRQQRPTGSGYSNDQELNLDSEGEELGGPAAAAATAAAAAGGGDGDGMDMYMQPPMQQQSYLPHHHHHHQQQQQQPPLGYTGGYQPIGQQQQQQQLQPPLLQSRQQQAAAPGMFSRQIPGLQLSGPPSGPQQQQQLGVGFNQPADHHSNPSGFGPGPGYTAAASASHHPPSGPRSGSGGYQPHQPQNPAGGGDAGSMVMQGLAMPPGLQVVGALGMQQLQQQQQMWPQQEQQQGQALHQQQQFQQQQAGSHPQQQQHFRSGGQQQHQQQQHNRQQHGSPSQQNKRPRGHNDSTRNPAAQAEELARQGETIARLRQLTHQPPKPQLQPVVREPGMKISDIRKLQKVMIEQQREEIAELRKTYKHQKLLQRQQQRQEQEQQQQQQPPQPPNLADLLQQLHNPQEQQQQQQHHHQQQQLQGQEGQQQQLQGQEGQQQQQQGGGRGGGPGQQGVGGRGPGQRGAGGGGRSERGRQGGSGSGQRGGGGGRGAGGRGGGGRGNQAGAAAGGGGRGRHGQGGRGGAGRGAQRGGGCQGGQGGRQGGGRQGGGGGGGRGQQGQPQQGQVMQGQASHGGFAPQ